MFDLNGNFAEPNSIISEELRDNTSKAIKNTNRSDSIRPTNSLDGSGGHKRAIPRSRFKHVQTGQTSHGSSSIPAKEVIWMPGTGKPTEQALWKTNLQAPTAKPGVGDVGDDDDHSSSQSSSQSSSLPISINSLVHSFAPVRILQLQ